MRSHKMASLLIFVAAVLLVPCIQSIEGGILKCPTISNGDFHPYCQCRYGPKYDEGTNTCPNPECPAYNSTGVYPNCTCSHKNFNYSIYLNECVRVCPENSTGSWPNCKCDADGYIFDKIEFKCIACPLDSTGVYPKCMCSKDRVYDKYSNLCERCEGGSVGIYPNCTCSDDAIYDASIRQCKVLHGSVKTDVKDIYESIDEAIGKNNDKEHSKKDDEDNDSNTEGEQRHNSKLCPFDSTGVYPNCICEQNGMYIAQGNYCLQCPWDSVGVYPNCTCERNGVYFNDSNSCYRCPYKSIGKYPDCSCSHPFQYENDKNKCLKCPENSTGIYPNCTCSHKNFDYSTYTNVCFRVCPEDSTGYWPSCNCDADGYVFDKIEFECSGCPLDSPGIYPKCMCSEDSVYDKYSNSCERREDDEDLEDYWKDYATVFENNSEETPKCPKNSSGIYPNCTCTKGYFSRYHVRCDECPENSTGFYPECQCLEEDHEFSGYINECYIPCPENSNGKHPKCKCDDGYYYVVNEFLCKSNIGRKCPLDSVGVGPDCLCVRKNFRFDSNLWSCAHKTTTLFFVHTSSTCDKGYSGKWPQCELSVDLKVLISSVG